MDNDIDMASRQPSPPKAPQVGRIAVIIAIILFIVGLVVYVSSFGETADTTEPQDSTTPPASTTPQATRVEGQVIIKFKKGVTDAQITQRLSPLNASIKSKIDGIGATVVNVPPGQEDAVLKELSTDPLVQYAEPDYIYYLQFTPNDPDFSKQWGLANTGQVINNRTGKVDADIDAEAAWDVSRGTGVKVAILDSGIDAQHPDLASKIVGSKAFESSSVVDENGHGTHVAGIVAAATNNGQGIAGVCPDCQLLIGKIANAEGSVTGSAFAPSITWAADNGAQVINMSVAGTSFSQAVQDAVNYAWGKNVVIVAAAGNTGGTSKMYPAAYANVVSVANTNNIDVRRTDSTHGPWVQIAAPGDFIYSTFPRTENTIGKLNYGFLSGTSMASPAVAGVAALVWKTQYGTNNAAVVERLYSTAEKISGTGSSWKSGRVNAAAAVGTAAPSTGPSGVPSPSVPFVCGGSTNSICPIPSTSIPVPSSGNTAPTSGTNQPTNPVPSGSVNPTNPCENGTASLAHNRKSKHKKRSQGWVNRFVNWILRFFIELINWILKLIGGGQIPVPTNPNNPNNPGNPNPPQPGPCPSPSIVQPSVTQPQPSISLSPAPSSSPSIPATSNGTRDPLKQPFASNSIWNMPIGSNAVYVPANMEAVPSGDDWAPMPGIDDEHIVLKPTAPMVTINYSDAGWSGKNRCNGTGGAQGGLPVSVPIPNDYVIPHDNTNSIGVFLLSDGRTIVQTQPLARCTAGGAGTSVVKVPNVDLYGDGILGAHGGSNLSALGGSIRVGELRPGGQPPRHTLKVNVDSQRVLYPCTTQNECFRWPAQKADSGAVGSYGSQNPNSNPALKMGSLLAIPKNTNINSLGLESEPGKMLAWTFQNYGAYIVDETGGPGFDLSAENGPDGNMHTQFKNDWGYDLEQRVNSNTVWSRDMQKIVKALAVVDNNTQSSIGGGGTPLQPLAPPIAPK